MADIGESPFQLFQSFLGSVDEPSLRRLFELCAWGRWGPGAQAWVREFREFGVLHLLVLSGSQVSFLRGPLQKMNGALLRPIFGRGVAADCLLRLSVAGVLLAYGFTAGWSPPLARAVFLALWDLAWPRGALVWKCLLALAVQGLIFPHDCGSLSFLLSWSCFLWLQVSRQFSRPWQRHLFVALLCPAWAAWILALPPDGVFGAARLIAANAVLGCLFESFLMPLLGGLLALAFVLWAFPLGLAWPLGKAVATFAGPLLAGSGGLVLVALGGFRYIRDL